MLEKEIAEIILKWAKENQHTDEYGDKVLLCDVEDFGKLASQIAERLEIDTNKTAKEYYKLWNEGRENGWENVLNAKKHTGDCTKQPHTCLLCFKEDCFEFAEALATQKPIKIREER